MAKAAVAICAVALLAACGGGKENSPSLAGYAPQTPGGVAAVSGDGTVTVSWAKVKDVSSYTLYYASTSGITHANATKIEGIKATSYTHGGLKSGTPYYYAVSSVKDGLESGLTTETSGVPRATQLSAPSSVAAIGAGNGVIKVTWNSVPGAASYTVYSSQSAGVAASKSVAPVKVSGNSYIHAGLAAGAQYYYAVAASNESGEGAVSPETGTAASLPAPMQPDGVSIVATQEGMKLRWKRVAGAESYNVYIAPSTTGLKDARTVKKEAGINKSEYIHTTPKKGRQYYYCVTAIGSGGESPPSNIVGGVL